MTIGSDAQHALEREFLGLRARILEVAATLDRIDRAEGAQMGDPRVAQIRDSFSVLLDASGDRAEQVQMIFSLPYDDNWRHTLSMPR